MRSLSRLLWLWLVRNAVADIETNIELSAYERLHASTGDSRLFLFSRLMKTGSSSFVAVAKEFMGSNVTRSCKKTTKPAIVLETSGFKKSKTRATSPPVILRGEPADFRAWQDIRDAEGKIGDVWLQGHPLNFEVGNYIATTELSHIREVYYVSIIRSPFTWIRSHYEHGHARGQTIDHFFATHGLAYMAEHYVMALPESSRIIFKHWAEKLRGDPMFSRPLGSLVEWFARNMDFDEVEKHLRRHYVIFLTEYHNLGVALLNSAMCGGKAVLHDHHDMVRSHHTTQYSFDVETQSKLAPILAPFEAIYGIYSKIFFQDVGKYLH